MTEPTFADPDNPTVEELLALDDDAFAEEVNDDLRYTSRPQSHFQDPRLIQRTLWAILDRIWLSDANLRKQAIDPAVTPEHYRKALAFRRHLLAAYDITDRRAAWLEKSSAAHALSKWKTLLHDILDHLDGGAEDWILDELTTPFGNNPLTLRAWREIRVVKDLDRAPQQEVAA